MFLDDNTNGHQNENENSNHDSNEQTQKDSENNCEEDSKQNQISDEKTKKVQNSFKLSEQNGKNDGEESLFVKPATAAEDVINNNDEQNSSPCVSPPTCASPTFLKPTLIEDDDDHFLFPSSIGIQNNISVSGIPGTNNDIPVDKENPMRCVECGEEFLNHFR